jgi:AcrR family transcriptional regulator
VAIGRAGVGAEPRPDGAGSRRVWSALAARVVIAVMGWWVMMVLGSVHKRHISLDWVRKSYEHSLTSTTRIAAGLAGAGIPALRYRTPGIAHIFAMTNRTNQTKPAAVSVKSGVKPRKAPSQPRATRTVDTLLEGAAHVLEERGLAGYTTNAIAARAGVSIGSLYQYFPTKDAITVALIERERGDLVHEATQALALADRRVALHQLIAIAVRHQLRRPTLAALLDVEQHRLAASMPASAQGVTLHAALLAFLRDAYPAAALAPALAASELMAMISALTDAAGRAGEVQPALLVARIEGAVRGYLAAL